MKRILHQIFIVKEKIGWLISSVFYGLISPYFKMETFGNLPIRGRVHVKARGSKGSFISILIGQSSVINQDCVFQGAGTLIIGKRAVLNNRVFIICNSNVSIGDNCLIGPDVFITDTSHGFQERSVEIKFQPNEMSDVQIEDGVWIGRGASILKGVHIGHHSIVAAGAVVSKDVSPYSIVGGVPARLLKSR